MRHTLLSILIAVIATAAAAQTPQQWRDSLRVLNAQIDQQPSNTDLRLRKAAVNLSLAKWEYAEAEYGRVLDIDADNLAALYFRAYARHQQRHYDMAIADYDHFLRLMPRHFEAQLARAVTRRTMGRQAEALDELNRLVEMFPDSAVAFAARADLEQERGQYDLALYDYDEALRLSPASTDMLASKYSLLCAMRRYDEARALEPQLIERGIPRKALTQLQPAKKPKRKKK